MSISEKAAGAHTTAYENLRAHLGMKYNLVGVRLVKEQDYTPGMVDSMRAGERKWYCAMVKQAACGKTFAATVDDMGCPNSELALGLRKPKYSNMPTMIKDNIKAVVIGPIEGADVILFVLNPKQVMKLSIILGGMSADFKGEVAVCGEATAMVIAEGIPNMTLLCNGARMYGGYIDSEVVVGVPPYLVDKLEEKVAKMNKCGGALCGCLVSDMPREVTANFKEIGFEKSTDYFMGKIGSWSVRIYLNKDDSGALKQLTLYIPLKLKGEAPEVRPPFMTRARDGWLDIFTTLDTQSEGIDIYSGGGAMLKVFTDLITASIGPSGGGAN